MTPALSVSRARCQDAAPPLPNPARDAPGVVRLGLHRTPPCFLSAARSPRLYDATPLGGLDGSAQRSQLPIGARRRFTVFIGRRTTTMTTPRRTEPVLPIFVAPSLPAAAAEDWLQTEQPLPSIVFLGSVSCPT